MISLDLQKTDSLDCKKPMSRIWNINCLLGDNNKITVDVFAKATNSFTYVLPSTCCPKRNIENLPKGVTLHLRRICDTDEKFDVRSSEYQKYFIARNHRPTLIKKQFDFVKNISRSAARQPKTMTVSKSLRLVTTIQYNPVLTLPCLIVGGSPA